MYILWADLKVGTTNIGAERALCERSHGFSRDSGQAAEITGLALTLIARAARKTLHFCRRADEAGASKRLRSYRERGSIQCHNRNAGRPGDMRRTAVGSDIECSPSDEGAKLCEVEFSAFDNGGAFVIGQPGPRVSGD